jgi:hypothetical protein
MSHKSSHSLNKKEQEKLICAKKHKSQLKIWTGMIENN